MKQRIFRLMKKLQFAWYCFPKGDDIRFVQNVKEIGKVPELVILEKGKGIKEPNLLYHIYMEESYSGFFADYNKLLEYLYFAEYYNLIPIIEYSDKFCYAEKQLVNGTTNPFEYYFMQPCGLGIKELWENGVTILRSRKDNILLAKQLNQNMDGYSKSDIYLEHMARIVEKYIRLRPEIAEKFDHDRKEIICKMLKKPTSNLLGVHVRGTDFKKNYNGHPISVRVEEYLEEAVRLMETGRYEGIFLATDDDNALKIFKERFAGQITYYEDVIRSTGDETVMKSENKRENHHYKLGLEVLRDMYTLSACDGLIAGLSQVSYAARIQKNAEKKWYKDLKILDKGINYHRSVNCPKG